MDPQQQSQAQPQGDQRIPQIDSNGVHQNGLSQADLSQLSNGYMSHDQMAGLLPGHGFIPDPSMGGMPMPMPDAQLMMPMMLANGAPQVAVQPNGISADDIALYDRQIRLWGVAAQAKIQSANILLITIKALANEVAKNLVLAGVSSLTIADDALVTEADLGAQFFLSEADPKTVIGQNRAQAAAPAIQKLNPRVQVHVDPEGIKSKGPSYFGSFDVVIATDLDPDSFNLINTATRLNGRSFYAASTHGMYGFIFSDLIEHDFVIKRDLGNVATTPRQETRTRSIINVETTKEGPKTIESVTKRELYSTWFLASDAAVLPEDFTRNRRRLRGVSPALSCLRALWEFMQLQGGRVPGNREDLKLFTQIATQKHKALSLPSETLTPEFLRSFLQNLGSEIAPVTAILGGQLAQDVINVLSQKEQPIQNMVIFDGTTMEALMYPLHPEGSLGASLLSLDTGAGAGAPTGGNMMMGGMPGMGYDPSMGMPGVNGMGMGGMPDGMGMPMSGVQQQQMAQPLNGAPQNGHHAQGIAPQGAPQPIPQEQQQQQPAANITEAPQAQAQASASSSEQPAQAAQPSEAKAEEQPKDQ